MTNAMFSFVVEVVEVVDGAAVYEKREFDSLRPSMAGTFPIVHGPHHQHHHHHPCMQNT